MSKILDKLKDTFTPYAIVAARKAENKAGDTYPAKEQRDGRGDAYRHLVWQALMAKKQGSTMAKATGDYHESFMPQSLGGSGGFDQATEEGKMDYFNNALGRRIASEAKTEADIYKLAKQYIDQGIAKYIPLEEIEYRANIKALGLDKPSN